MRLPLFWLRDYLDVSEPVQQLVERLTGAGFEVEEVLWQGEGLSGVQIGRVAEVLPHPQADHLKRVWVALADRQVEVVCGAPKIQSGQMVAYAEPGAILPGREPLTVETIRSVRSEGMLCSAVELGLGPVGGSLLQLPDDAPLGQDLASYLGLPRPILEISLTPNVAGYAQSVVGMARELGALLRQPVRMPQNHLDLEGGPIQVQIADPDACAQYHAGVVDCAGGRQAPFWMQQRLWAAGLRTVDLIVDVTNFVLLELGQPLHAFDLEQLRGPIQVRRAFPEERLTTLDGRLHELGPNDLVIADAVGPQALAGVMGGRHAEVRAETRQVLLESALFDPTVVRRTARAHTIASDAAQRFEKGIDPTLPPVALARACALLTEYGEGIARGGASVIAKAPPGPQEVVVDPEEINALLGSALSTAEMKDALERLGFEVMDATVGWCVKVPVRRADVRDWQDLAEEVLRLVGVERIPEHLPLAPAAAAQEAPQARARREARQQMLALGYDEVVGYSLVGPEDLARCRWPSEARAVVNPLSVERSLLRPSLLMELARAAQFNQARRVHGIRIFEVGTVFGAEQLPRETLEMAALAVGPGPQHWRGRPPAPDFYSAKGLAEEVLSRYGLKSLMALPSTDPALHPTQQAQFQWSGATVARFGLVHPQVAAAYDLDTASSYVCISLAALLDQTVERCFEVPAAWPALRRDLSMTVDQNVPYGHIERIIKDAFGELLEELWLFDQYVGAPQVPAGQKSLAFGLRLRHPQRTLTDAQADAALAVCWQLLGKEVGAKQR